MAVNSKNKGNKNELALSKLFIAWTGKEFSRVPQSGGLHWQSKNSSGDIICTDDKHSRYFTLSIEAKHHKDISFEGLIDGSVGSKKTKIKEFWAQSLSDATDHKLLPIVFMRYDRMPKDMHFVVVTTKFFKEFHSLANWDHGILQYFAPAEDRLTILNSRDFFSMGYKKFHKIAKAYKKQLYR